MKIDCSIILLFIITKKIENMKSSTFEECVFLNIHLFVLNLLIYQYIPISIFTIYMYYKNNLCSWLNWTMVIIGLHFYYLLVVKGGFTTHYIVILTRWDVCVQFRASGAMLTTTILTQNIGVKCIILQLKI